jgi:hypothetical protein
LDDSGEQFDGEEIFDLPEDEDIDVNPLTFLGQ